MATFGDSLLRSQLDKIGGALRFPGMDFPTKDLGIVEMNRLIGRNRTDDGAFVASQAAQEQMMDRADAARRSEGTFNRIMPEHFGLRMPSFSAPTQSMTNTPLGRIQAIQWENRNRT
jgi:hypothetical protein